nr:immunoglobulin heavy chain junction region [Macaca mulatta]MOW47083.1 immunoglobulin heavy chain junction region [Macaca mulatta]MOW47126.1 immunoglobulin heavy chain junction region [Macaca mulatta]MOW48269.1 immunoglobulin heavy chain junction region [Macaca mulatta]MOW48434.1 immunoglobulin heavy chain junction region [Macaca mulatta]
CARGACSGGVCYIDAVLYRLDVW